MKERELAYNSLCKVILDKQFSNIVLRGNKENTAFVTQLVYGTLRNYRSIRCCWDKYVSKMPPIRISILIDMAVYELLWLKTPDYATINEIVDISKHIKGGAYANMINALLRKVNVKDLDNQSLAIATSHPDWMYALWKAHYGEDIAQQICKANIEEPRVALRVNTMKTTKEKLLMDPKFESGSVGDCVYYHGNIIDSEYFKNNDVIVQSESSQVVINNVDVKENMKILDMCAAPGSKSLQIASKLKNTGKVVANDLYQHRVELIRFNARRYCLTNIETCCHDATEISNFYQPDYFDIVLLDAPCSGLGTIKHKPEIKQNITDKDLDDIVSLQSRLFFEASKMVKVGGVIVYSTCTLNKKENDKQVANFLKQNSNFSLIKEETIFPFTYHSDGFYYAQLLRND